MLIFHAHPPFSPFLMSSIAEPQEVPQQILPLFAWDAMTANSSESIFIHIFLPQVSQG